MKWKRWHAVVLVIVVVCAVAVIGWKVYWNNVIEKGKSCSTDSDCVFISTQCCNNCGVQTESANQDHEHLLAYERNFRCMVHGPCPMYDCKPDISVKEPFCNSGSCDVRLSCVKTCERWQPALQSFDMNQSYDRVKKAQIMKLLQETGCDCGTST